MREGWTTRHRGPGKRTALPGGGAGPPTAHRDRGDLSDPRVTAAE
jgi:hypothetical protein